VRNKEITAMHKHRKLMRLTVWLLIISVASITYGASDAEREIDAVLASKPDAAHGEQMFVICAPCHGTNGGGTPDGRIPEIAGQHFRVIAAQLVDFRLDQRWDALMEHYSDAHNLGEASDIADVAAYISRLQPVYTSNLGDGRFASNGSTLYARSCAPCHGAAGNGQNRRGYPRLAGQHYAYLLRQMHDAVDGRRPNFSRTHVRLLASLGRSDFEALADYLARSGRESLVAP
jgi:cytochrome c553